MELPEGAHGPALEGPTVGVGLLCCLDWGAWLAGVVGWLGMKHLTEFVTWLA